MTLIQKLERDTLQRQCKKEVEDLHKCFVQWFQGTQPKQELSEELNRRLRFDFSHVAPNGQFLLGRKTLLGHLDDKYSCYQGRVFEIDIYNVQLLWKDDDGAGNCKCLCTYEEWQSWKQQKGEGDDEEEDEEENSDDDNSKGTESSLVQFGRLSSCLLERNSETNAFQWVHVHETWLEAEKPTIVSSAATPKAATTPVVERRPTTFPVHQDVKEEKMVLFLMSNQSMSREQVTHQEKAKTILTASGVPFEEIDGTDYHQHEFRNKLFDISGILGKYPQFFIREPKTDENDEDSRITFWGDWHRFEEANENGTLVKDLGVPSKKLISDDLEASLAEEDEDKEESPTKEEDGRKKEEESENEEDDSDKDAADAVSAAAVGAVAGAAAASAVGDKEDEDPSNTNFTEGANGAPSWAVDDGETPQPAQPAHQAEPEAAEEEGSMEEDDHGDNGATDESGEEPEEEGSMEEPDDGLIMEPEDDEEGGEDDDESLPDKERTFLEASQGILVFEEEDEEPTPDDSKANPSTPQKEQDVSIEEIAAVASPIPHDASSKRHVSPKLSQFAEPLTWEQALVGVSIAGFDIGTSQGPIGDETWFDQTGQTLEELAQSRTVPNPRRKICLPEMVFPTAHVALEGHGFWLSWDAMDALEEWAKAHREISMHSRISHNGVSVIRSKDAKLWEAKRKHGKEAAKGVSSAFHYDWTFSTPFAGKVEGGQWQELEESGMRMSLLTDRSVPILFFDEIVLFEDDMHDNGQVELAAKLRVMPTCAYVLARLWCRVDEVFVRVRETRVLIDFFGMKPQVYRDVTWRECNWVDLAKHGLPTDVRSWVYEGKETPEWSDLLKRIPETNLPKGLAKHAVLDYVDTTQEEG